MKHHQHHYCLQNAFTLVELLVVIAVIAIIGLAWPKLFMNDRPKAVRINCVSNLRQVGLAFRIYAGDNDDHYPMSSYTNAAGEQLFANAALAYRYFQVMSNELNNPQIVHCPDDKKQNASTNFSSDFRGSNVSYFIGLEADARFPQLFLTGDNHLTNDLPLKQGILELSPKHPAGWTPERHGGGGNIGMADGSVQQLSTYALQKFIQDSNITERLLIPNAGATK